MHLLILDANAGTGTGHNLSFSGILAQAAHDLGWELTTVAPHPLAAVPQHFEPVAPSYVPGRPRLRNVLAQRTAVRRAGAIARATGVDLIVDSYLQPDLGLHTFGRGVPPRARITHHELRLQSRPRRPLRRLAAVGAPTPRSLERLVAAGDLFVSLDGTAMDTLPAQVPADRIISTANPMTAPSRAAQPGSEHRAKPRVAFLGETRRDKGWDALLAALRHVTVPFELHAITASDAPASGTTIGVVDITHDRDVIDHGSFRAAVAGCDAAVVPHTAAFGMRTSGTLLEVLAAGLPAVVGVALAPHLPTDGVGYRQVDPEDAAAFAAALDALLQDLPQARAAAATSGPALVEAAHDPRTVLQAIARGAGLAP